MPLRNHLESDLAAMMNTSEFGEDITFEGIPLVAIVDRGSEAATYDERQSVYVETVTLHLPVSAITCPAMGRQVDFNGEDWVAGERDEEDGLLILKLWRDRA